MKINKIVVEGLFGIFDHEIPINNQEGITIIIGENGLGKTIIFEMIEAFFNNKFDFFESIEFKKLVFEFEDNVKARIIDEKQLNNYAESMAMVKHHSQNEIYEYFKQLNTSIV